MKKAKSGRFVCEHPLVKQISTGPGTFTWVYLYWCPVCGSLKEDSIDRARWKFPQIYKEQLKKGKKKK